MIKRRSLLLGAVAAGGAVVGLRYAYMPGLRGLQLGAGNYLSFDNGPGAGLMDFLAANETLAPLGQAWLASLEATPAMSDILQSLAGSVDLNELRNTLVEFVDEDLSNLVTDIDGSEAVPTAAFQRVIQRAAIHVQSSGRTEVTGANVLVAIFAERESNAAYFLQEQDMTRYDAVNFIAHGVAKDPAFGEQRPVSGSTDPLDEDEFIKTLYKANEKNDRIISKDNNLMLHEFDYYVKVFSEFV